MTKILSAQIAASVDADSAKDTEKMRKKCEKVADSARNAGSAKNMHPAQDRRCALAKKNAECAFSVYTKGGTRISTYFNADS